MSKRISFSQIKKVIGYPDFLEVQLRSFQEFMQVDTIDNQCILANLHCVQAKGCRMSIQTPMLISYLFATFHMRTLTQILSVLQALQTTHVYL